MMESKVFADNFSRSFSESGDFFQFLSARQARSKWMTAPSKELRFEPVERGSTLGNLYMQIYDHNGDADVLEDTMENTSLLLKVDGKDYPVRSCALKTVLERARISGHALNKVSKSVFAEILNYCMGVASGDSLIKVADEKVSAVHGGDPKDYTVMEMLPLFKATNDFLDREYPGNRFMTAHFDHSIQAFFIDYVRKDGATAILACVEYDPNKEALQTVVYGNCASDEPTEIVEHYNTDFEE